MLAAAMNPRPCGYFGGPMRECQLYAADDSALRIENFRALLDRVDIQIEVPSVKYKELRGPAAIEDSAAVRVRVIEARKRHHKRFLAEKNTYSNAQMAPKMIRKHCAISADRERLLGNAVSRLGLSARAHDRILKASRTIADRVHRSEAS
jgi:magnesium chelatase family protein